MKISFNPIVIKNMSIITTTTDYGLKDHFVGALKGKYYLSILKLPL
jgi:hypothetical protein